MWLERLLKSHDRIARRGEVMSAIILLDADCPHTIHVLEDPSAFGENLVFSSVDAADMWLQKNAQMGWCTRIIDTDD